MPWDALSVDFTLPDGAAKGALVKPGRLAYIETAIKRADEP